MLYSKDLFIQILYRYQLDKESGEMNSIDDIKSISYIIDNICTVIHTYHGTYISEVMTNP